MSIHCDLEVTESSTNKQHTLSTFSLSLSLSQGTLVLLQRLTNACSLPFTCFSRVTPSTSLFSIQVNINPTLQKCEHCPVVVKKTQIVFAPAPSRQTQSAAWTSTVAIIPTQYHEPPPNTRPQYACGRPLSHEQCKEGKTQQNSETRVFLRVHPFLSMDEQCPL